MITTKRNVNGRSESYATEAGNVALLEREASVASYNEYANPAPAEREENLEQARARMQENLDKLLNYDRYGEEVASATKVEEHTESKQFSVESPVSVATPVSEKEEDIRPTSTTMQFGDGDLDQMYKEMNVKSEDKESYHLNSKGKLAVVLYSLAIAVVLALIILNTGLLAKLNTGNELRQAELNGLMSSYAEQQSDLANISANDYVIDLAENRYGMVKR